MAEGHLSVVQEVGVTTRKSPNEVHFCRWQWGAVMVEVVDVMDI